ncbi:hypothetical protein AA313_de0207991 [Arthrobotrys entomopaga]|nr:hypothetical protein AA313_de0207991 [Arthrobotrys entomopaga]
MTSYHIRGEGKAALLVYLYLGAVAAWWQTILTAIRREDITQPGLGNREISQPFEYKSTGAKTRSFPSEAVTIYNTYSSRVVDSVAYYRQPNCRLAAGTAEKPDFLIFLDPNELMGVNVVDLTYLNSDVDVVGAPLSFREVDRSEFSMSIYAETKSPPVAGSIYRWDRKGDLKEIVHAPGVIRNVQLEDYATPEELAMVQQDVNKTPNVLRSVTERVLEGDPGRGDRMLGYLGMSKRVAVVTNKNQEKRQKKQSKAKETGQIIDPPLDFQAPTEQNESTLTASTRESLPPKKNKKTAATAPKKKASSVANPPSNEITDQKEADIAGKNNIPLPSVTANDESVNIPSPHEIANRPINHEMMVAQCLLSGDPLLWCQRYLAAQKYHERLAKAAFDIMQGTPVMNDVGKGGLLTLTDIPARERISHVPELEQPVNAVPPKKPEVEDKGTQVDSDDFISTIYDDLLSRKPVTRYENVLPLAFPPLKALKGASDEMASSLGGDLEDEDLNWVFPSGWRTGNRGSRIYQNRNPLRHEEVDDDFDFNTFLYNTQKKLKTESDGFLG